jgi:RNA polymerase sigma-70 factor (ECF subfamily)
MTAVEVDPPDAGPSKTVTTDGGASDAEPSDAEPSDAGPSDAELLRRHLAGDPDAFGLVVRRHSDRAWAVAIGMLRDREDAADAVQEAMLAALRGVTGFRGEASVGTWLHRIVVNACLDRMRRRKARPTVPMPAEAERSLAAPGDEMATREDRVAIEAALARLPDAQRAALVLVDVEGRPVAEAAAMLGVPVGTVKSRCARARSQLAVMLGYLRPGNQAAVPNVSERERSDRCAHTPDTRGEVIGDDP